MTDICRKKYLSGMPVYAMRKMLLGNDATNVELQERPLDKYQHASFPKLCLACSPIVAFPDGISMRDCNPYDTKLQSWELTSGPDSGLIICLVPWERLGSPGECAIFTSKPIAGLTSFDAKKEGMTGGPFRRGFHDRTPYLYGIAETSPTPMFGLLPMDSVRQCFGTYSNCYKYQVNIKRSSEKLEDADSKKQRPIDDETPAINAPPMNVAWAIDTMHSKLMSMAQEESTVMPHE